MSKRKNKSHQIKPFWPVFLGFILLSVVMWLLLRGNDLVLFNPKGAIAHEQMRLMIIATLVMMEICIPALFLFYYFAWKYRDGNEKATYDANAGQGRTLAFAAWAFPVMTAVLLTVLLLPATQKLDTKKVIGGDPDPLTIQVVALRWKWLFIYPEQNIATVNYVQIPENKPVQFEITADDAPMSSFWIPHLGGMLYAMTGHVNRLNLVGNDLGDFTGSAAELNGQGMAGMRFTTRVSSQADYEKWLNETSSSPTQLTAAEYEKLLVPNEDHPAALFSSPESGLFGTILNKYAYSHQHSEVKE